jgi:hypothetical protein
VTRIAGWICYPDGHAKNVVDMSDMELASLADSASKSKNWWLVEAATNELIYRNRRDAGFEPHYVPVWGTAECSKWMLSGVDK